LYSVNNVDEMVDKGGSKAVNKVNEKDKSGGGANPWYKYRMSIKCMVVKIWRKK